MRRLDRIATALSVASRGSVSGTGVWLTPSSAASVREESSCPGVIWPVTSRARNCDVRWADGAWAALDLHLRAHS